jgi:vacuolar-type H+-ATPase subunit H
MSNISFCVNGLLKKIKTKQRKTDQTINLFSKEQKKHIQQVQIKKDKIIIYLYSSAALYEFNLNKNNLTQKMNQQTKQIKQIVFKIGKQE